MATNIPEMQSVPSFLFYFPFALFSDLYETLDCTTALHFTYNAPLTISTNLPLEAETNYTINNTNYKKLSYY